MSPSFTFVIFTGSLPSLSDTLIEPSVALANLGPSLPPICTVSKDTLSFVANVNLPAFCVILMFLSASKVTLSPAFTNWLVASLPNSPAVVAADVAVQAALFTAFTTVSTVAILPASSVLTATVPALSPESTGLIVPVLTFKPLASVVRVLSAAFTLILLSLVFSKPSPRFALYLIVLVLPSVFVTDTLVPSPSTKLTVS